MSSLNPFSSTLRRMNRRARPYNRKCASRWETGNESGSVAIVRGGISAFLTSQ